MWAARQHVSKGRAAGGAAERRLSGRARARLLRLLLAGGAHAGRSRGNNLTGDIPPIFGSTDSLQILDLSGVGGCGMGVACRGVGCM